MQLSNRIQKMEFSPIRKFIPYAEQAEAAGKKVYYMNIGQPDIKTPEVFFDAVRNYKPDVLAYANSHGIPQLLEAIQGYYGRLGVDYDFDDIIVTQGGSEAISMLCTAIIDDGDNVLMPEPFYANYKTMINAAGGEISVIPTTAEDGYLYATRENFEAAINPRTKAIIIVSPNNPTGKVLSEEDMRMIAEVAVEHNLYLICDEVYREFTYDGREMRTFGAIKEAEQNVVLVDSVSKRFSACGARIGAVVSKNKELMFNLMKICQARLSVATIDQIGAAALYAMDPSYFNEIKAEYEHRRNLSVEALDEIEGIKYGIPEGAFYITAQLPVDDSEKFLVFLLSEFDVDGETAMFAPACGFYETPGAGRSDIRLAYALNADDMRKGINIIKEGIKAYNAKNA